MAKAHNKSSNRGKATTRPEEMHLTRAWNEPHLARHDAALRMADLAQLEEIAGTYKSREKFLTDLTLDPPDATSGRARAPILDDEYTILSTTHSTKGQECKIVRVLNVVDGCIPSDMATATPEEIEEERRLLHVAMTRAKDELDLIVPQRFYTHNQSATSDRRGSQRAAETRLARQHHSRHRRWLWHRRDHAPLGQIEACGMDPAGAVHD